MLGAPAVSANAQPRVDRGVEQVDDQYHHKMKAISTSMGGHDRDVTTWIAWMKRKPMPGHWNTVSVTIAKATLARSAGRDVDY